MNKHHAKQIREVAQKLPLVYVWEEGSTVMKGWELNLTPLSDNQRFEKEVDYKVSVPQMRAVEHEQQLKDAFKRKGVEGVKQYTESVVNRVRSGEFVQAIIR